jgi:histidinol phosphatase-like PHP family hydrolase
VAIEINGKSRVPTLETVRHFAARGATFALGSDGHSPEGVGDLRHAEATWIATGLPETRLLVAPPGFGDL